MPTHDENLSAPAVPAGSTNPHGQAALLLVESLIHGLMERSILTAEDACEIIETATDVQADYAEAADGHGAVMWQSHQLLAAMSHSIRGEIDSQP